MAYLILLFLDLTGPMPKQGDDALYRQALIDHHLKGPITVGGRAAECKLQRISVPDGKGVTLFSRIGWTNEGGWIQINASDAVYCSLYLQSGASYRLVRELRLPAAMP
jgi:hypothetical protein